MSQIAASNEIGMEAPARLKRLYWSTYLHIPSGLAYRQVGLGNNNLWEEIKDPMPIIPGAKTKVFKGILNQNGISAPTVHNVIENSFGSDPIISRNNAGDFRIALTGVVEEKTMFTGTANLASWFSIEGVLQFAGSIAYDYNIAQTDELILRTWNNNVQDQTYGTLVDGAFDGWSTFIHIEVPI